MMKLIKILLVGPVNKCSLAEARALQMTHNYEIHLVTESQGVCDIFLRKLSSRSISRTHFLKEKYHEPDFVDRIIQIVKTYEIDVVLPTASAAIPLSKGKDKLAEFCKVATEDYHKVIKFHDKSETMMMARELGIPHPSTLITTDSKEVERYSLNTNYPVVIKARKSSGARGVWYAKNPQELMKLYEEVTKKQNRFNHLLEDWSNPILQQYIPGEVHHVAAFCVEGQIKVGMTQKPIITKPLSGGESIVTITTYNEEALNCARRIVEHSGWNGPIFFNFIVDERDNILKLLEVNPRLWASVWLSVCAGLNYPHFVVQQTMGNNVEHPEVYKVGLICRWPLEELQVIFEKPLSFFSTLNRIYGFISRFRYKECEYEVILADIIPVMVKVMKALKSFPKKSLEG